DEGDEGAAEREKQVHRQPARLQLVIADVAVERAQAVSERADGTGQEDEQQEALLVPEKELVAEDADALGIELPRRDLLPLGALLLQARLTIVAFADFRRAAGTARPCRARRPGNSRRSGRTRSTGRS